MKNELHDILTTFIHELSNTTSVTEYCYYLCRRLANGEGIVMLSVCLSRCRAVCVSVCRAATVCTLISVVKVLRCIQYSLVISAK